MSNDFPFPKGWFTAGRGELWNCSSTYCFVPYENLPLLDSENFDGSFQWLIDSADESEEQLSAEDLAKLIDNLNNLSDLARQFDLNLPDSFIKFITTSHLRNRIESCTGCYFDLSNRFITSPGDKHGYLIRFLNDSQNVLLWYLYLNNRNENCVVAARPEFLDEPENTDFSYNDKAENETIDDVVIPKDIYYCAPDFEEFIYRFWIENSIWFALNDNRILTEEQEKYKATGFFQSRI